MANLTISIDAEALKRARLKALQEGTSVNALLRGFLNAYAGIQRDQQNAARRIIALSRRSRSGRGERSWTREELHERK